MVESRRPDTDQAKNVTRQGSSGKSRFKFLKERQMAPLDMAMIQRGPPDGPHRHGRGDRPRRALPVDR